MSREQRSMPWERGPTAEPLLEAGRQQEEESEFPSTTRANTQAREDDSPQKRPRRSQAPKSNQVLSNPLYQQSSGGNNSGGGPHRNPANNVGNINDAGSRISPRSGHGGLYDHGEHDPEFVPIRGTWLPVVNLLILIALAVLSFVFPSEKLWGTSEENVISHLVLLHLGSSVLIYGICLILLALLRAELAKGYVRLFEKVHLLCQGPKYLSIFFSGVLLFLWVLHTEDESQLKRKDVKLAMQVMVLIEVLVSVISSILAILHLSRHNADQLAPEGVEIGSTDEEGQERAILVNEKILLYGASGIDASRFARNQRQTTHDTTIGSLAAASPRHMGMHSVASFAEGESVMLPSQREGHQQEPEDMEKARARITDLQEQIKILRQANNTYQNRAAEAWENKRECEREKDNLIQLLKRGATAGEVNEIIRKRNAEVETLEQEHASQKETIDKLQNDLDEATSSLNKCKRDLRSTKSKYKNVAKENEELHEQLEVERKYIEELEKLVPAEQDNYLMSDTSDNNTSRSRQMSSSMLQQTLSAREDSLHNLSRVSRQGRYGAAQHGTSGYSSGPVYMYREESGESEYPPRNGGDGALRDQILRTVSDSKRQPR
eukprot:gb/GECG01009575.1/.p1 GENE.gb/GECG01009575.1/~~gb/GECG01009575.1/.p1  ORF type:complete len:606 (+),score=88.63 gb/GECG01009575.1/:1-1818(+)